MHAYITAIGTANPPYRTSQKQFADFYADVVGFGETERRKLKAFYRYTRIRNRFSVLPDFGRRKGDFTFFPNDEGREAVPCISRRMELFQAHAGPLGLEAARSCLARAGEIDPGSVDHLITVSSTGMYAPGLDIDLIEGLGLRTTVGRIAINFMGCFAAINALRVADALCRDRPDERVLIVNVELPSIHFRDETNEECLVSNALFGDGATAMLVEGSPSGRPSLGLGAFHADLALRGKDDMLWRIRRDRFEVRLSEYVPMIVKGDVGQVVDGLLAAGGLALDDIAHFAFHPGGRAILEAIETQVGISAEDNRFAYEVLRDYGNMSSCTLVFVLERILASLSEADRGRKVLGCAFGPGLTIEGLILEVAQVTASVPAGFVAGSGFAADFGTADTWLERRPAPGPQFALGAPSSGDSQITCTAEPSTIRSAVRSRSDETRSKVS